MRPSFSIWPAVVARRAYSSRLRSNSVFASFVSTSCCQLKATVLSTDHSVTGDASATRFEKANSSSAGSASSALETNDSLGMNAMTISGDAPRPSQ